ncbi:MAG: HAMP domain-containing protein [Rhodocyclaceae bacterium]|nr:HAMP domain-containing protein [Rhodocyclaceae bacterium]
MRDGPYEHEKTVKISREALREAFDATRILARDGVAVPELEPDPDATRVLARAEAAPADSDATRVMPRQAAHDADASEEDATLALPAPEYVSVVVPRQGGEVEGGGEDGTVVMPLPQTRPTANYIPSAGVANETLPKGYRLHEYRIERVLGQGGFGVTYLASDIHLHSRVAIKEYLPGQIAHRVQDHRVSARGAKRLDLYLHGLENFLVEARTLATFRHPNIVRVARFFEANNTAYMVLEYERGKSLRDWWPDHASMGERDLLDLLAPLLHGLETVHGAGFMHRDIKPDNISVRADDGSLVLLDFGSAGPTGGREGEVTMITPGYGPIEQYGSGAQGPWTDIYALGATLYWMLFGEKPPEATLRLGEVDPLPAAAERGAARYSQALLKAVDWALEPHAPDRPQSVDEFRRALFAADPAAMALTDALAASLDRPGVPTRKGTWSTRLKDGLHRLIRPASWPLSAKMTVAMVLAALTPMLITAYYNLTASTDRVSAGELRNLTQLADSLAARVSQLLADNRKLSRYLASDDALVAVLEGAGGRDPRPQDRLDDLVRANPDVQLAMLYDRVGTIVLSSDPAVVGKNFAFRDYFQRAILGHSYVSGVIVGAVAGQPGIFFAEPARNGAGEVVGVIVLRVKGEAVDQILERGRQPGEREPFLIDADGIILHHHDDALLYHSLQPLVPEVLREILSDRRFRRDRIDSLGMPELATAMIGATQPGNVAYASTISGQPEIAGFAPVADHDWVVGVTEPRAYFESPLNRLFRNVLASVVLVGFLFVLIAIFFARSLLRPILSLTAAADALRGGDYSAASVKASGRDELGQLARTFNVMVDVLRQRERERERGRGGSA